MSERHLNLSRNRRRLFLSTETLRCFYRSSKWPEAEIPVPEECGPRAGAAACKRATNRRPYGSESSVKNSQAIEFRGDSGDFA